MVACEGMVRWSCALKDKDNHLFVDPDVEEHWRDVESHRLDLLKREKRVDPVWKLFLVLFISHIGSMQ